MNVTCYIGKAPFSHSLILSTVNDTFGIEKHFIHFLYTGKLHRTNTQMSPSSSNNNNATFPSEEILSRKVNIDGCNITSVCGTNENETCHLSALNHEAT